MYSTLSQPPFKVLFYSLITLRLETFFKDDSNQLGFLKTFLEKCYDNLYSKNLLWNPNESL